MSGGRQQGQQEREEEEEQGQERLTSHKSRVVQVLREIAGEDASRRTHTSASNWYQHTLPSPTSGGGEEYTAYPKTPIPGNGSPVPLCLCAWLYGCPALSQEQHK